MMRSLNPRELRELGELVHSPYFNKSESTKKLFDYLRKQYPEFKTEAVEKKRVHGIIFGKAEYNDGFMRTLIFNLGELVEEFFRQMAVRKNTARSELLLLEELNSRKLEREFVKNLGIADKEIEKLNGCTENYYYYRYVYQELLIWFLDWSRFKVKNMTGNIDEEMIKENKYLSSFSFIKQLANYRNLAYRKDLMKVTYEPGILDMVIDYIISSPEEFKDTPSVMQRVCEVQLIKTREDKYYRQLKGILLNGEDIADDRYNLLNILQEYCGTKQFEGDNSYTPERFELYKTAVENNFYRSSHDVYLDSIMFTSIAVTAVKAGEYEWAEKFINKCKDELSPEVKEPLTAYALGRIYFEKGEQEKALKEIEGIGTTRHFQHKVIIRNLVLMVYYELGWFDKAEQSHASYRQFLSKSAKQFSPQRYDRFMDFLRYYINLMKLKANIGGNCADKALQRNLLSLRKDLDENPNILERDWLLAKAMELGKG